MAHKHEIIEILPRQQGDPWLAINGDGDVINYPEEVSDTLHRYTDEELRYDHTEYGAAPRVSDDPSPGPSVLIRDRLNLLGGTLNHLADAHMAEGRLNNPGPLARTRGISETSVREDASLSYGKNIERARSTFGELMGGVALEAAGFDTSELDTLRDFDSQYFGTPAAKKQNAKLRRKLEKLIKPTDKVQ